MRRQQEVFEEFQAPRNPQSDEVSPDSVPNIMQRLEQLSEQIENNPHHACESLKEYITVYVQNHNRSEEFFNLMCEHNMIAKLFTGGVARPIYILETFNLLLANTQKVHQLVYIFSHPLFHNYLLINVESMLQPANISGTSSGSQSSIALASHQCIEYYIQLIKTLITKLQAESSECTLLKLFCNSKYSYYPLLTNCIILAIKRNIKQELVRVTAQHCILQLVGIMSRKQVGEYYFSNIHMIIFFYQIIHQTIEEETQHSQSQDTTIKYLTDLIKAINLSRHHQAKQKSFLLFFTIFSNLLTFKFMKNPAPGLHMLFKFSNGLKQIEELRQLSSKYLTPVYFIFGKLIFNKYLNNITLSSIILSTEAISELSNLKDVNILKIIKTHYEKNPLSSQQIQIEKERNSYEEEQAKRQSLPKMSFKNSMLKIRQQVFEKEYEHIWKQIERYNMDNEEFFSLKQNFYKKSTQSSNSNWLFGIGNIFKKINIFDIASNDYMKRLSHIASVKYGNEQPIKFLDEVLSPSAVYMYEFLKIKGKEKYLFGQKTEDTQKIEISFNENRDEFACTIQLFKVVMNISDAAIGEIELLWDVANRLEVFEKLQQTFNPKLEHLGEVYFMLHFRQYFQHSIFEYICTPPNGKPRIDLTSKLINYLYNLSSTLVFELTEMNLNKIKVEAIKLEKQLYSIINEKGFEAFCEYLQSDQEKQMVESVKRLSMSVSMVKFDKRDSTQDFNKKGLSSARKKKSIFKSFTKSSSNKESPKKNISPAEMKESQTLKIVETKMLHLQLLRFLLEQPSMGSSMKSLDQKMPLYKIFEGNFTKKYMRLLEKSKDEQILYQAERVGLNSEPDYECTFRVRVNFSDFTIVCQLLHKQKLVLKCNIKEFSLSKPQLKDQKEPLTIHHYMINLYPTTNALGFIDMNRAIELLNTVNEIKFGFRQIKDSAILEYLNKENQMQN